MNSDNLRAAASRIVSRMVREHPDVSAIIAALVLSEILSLGLFDGDDGEVTAFADAVNGKLAEIAEHHGAPSSWQLSRTPQRH